MRKSLGLFMVVLIVCAGILLLCPACGRKETATEKIEPYRASSFQEVTSQLDPGGSFYLYAGTDQFLKWLDDLFRYLLSPEVIATMGENPQKAVAGVQWLQKMLLASGIMSIDGIGISSLPMTADLHHSTLVIHRSAYKNDELISQWTQPSPRPLESLRLLPADTVFASFSDHKLEAVWQWLDQYIGQSALADPSAAWQGMKAKLNSAGIDPKKLLASLDREIGLVITLDRTLTFSIPGASPALNFPQPALALVVDTRDDSLFELVHKTMTSAAFSEEKGDKTLSLPAFPLPFEFSLRVCQTKNRLIVASSKTLLDRLRNGVPNGQALVDDPEFQNLAWHMPDSGNGFRYLSSRLWDSIRQVIQQKKQQADSNSSAAAGIGFIDRLLPQKLALYSVVRHRRDSIDIRMNHSFPSGQLLLLPAVSSIGIVSAIALPNLIKAKEKAQQLETLNQADEFQTPNADDKPGEGE